MLLELGMMAGGVQSGIVMQHRLALLHLKVFWTTVLVFVVQVLLVVPICTPASAEDGLLGLPWIWFIGKRRTWLDRRAS